MMRKLLKILSPVLTLSLANLACAEIVSIEVPHNELGLTPVVDVYVNGEGPYGFAIDTAASQSSIKRELAENLGIEFFQQDSLETLAATELVYYDVSELINLEISSKKLLRKTRVNITDRKFEGYKNVVGVLGVSQMLNGTLENDAEASRLVLRLPSKASPCDFIDRSSACSNSRLSIIEPDFTIGKHSGKMILDTGYSGYKSVLLFKSNFTNALWSDELKHVDEIPTPTLADEGSSKFFRTEDFSFMGSTNCPGKFLVRNPKHDSVLTQGIYGLLGWSAIKDYNFSIDFSESTVEFEDGFCPWKNELTLGIASWDFADDQTSITIVGIESNSPADRVGLMDGDKVVKMILSNGMVIDNFNYDILNFNDKNVYAPRGSKVTYFVERDARILKFEMIAEGEAVVRIFD